MQRKKLIEMMIDFAIGGGSLKSRDELRETCEATLADVERNSDAMGVKIKLRLENPFGEFEWSVSSRFIYRGKIKKNLVKNG